MKFINQISLTRGRMLLDYALSNRGENLSLEVADLIGLVGAYIAEGKIPDYMEDCLSELLHPSIAAQAAKTFELFQDDLGRGLWAQGPAMDDVTFTHPKLIAAFPDFVPLIDRIRPTGETAF